MYCKYAMHFNSFKFNIDQINIAVFFWYLVKSECPVYASIHMYTVQVTLYKVPEKHGHVYLVTLCYKKIARNADGWIFWLI